jgi:2-polyprenyl-6-methoxyphenol hydroxylase-like FAD-dependent oxidoreductase
VLFHVAIFYCCQSQRCNSQLMVYHVRRTPVEGMVKIFSFCSHAGRARPGEAHTSPTSCAHLPQHTLLPLLVESAKAQPLCSLRFNHSVQGLQQGCGMVKVHAQTERVQETICGRYVLACAPFASHSPSNNKW